MKGNGHYFLMGTVCVTSKAWSDSSAFGGGGSGSYRLKVIYRDVASPSEIELFRRSRMDIAGS